MDLLVCVRANFRGAGGGNSDGLNTLRQLGMVGFHAGGKQGGKRESKQWNFLKRHVRIRIMRAHVRDG